MCVSERARKPAGKVSLPGEASSRARLTRWHSQVKTSLSHIMAPNMLYQNTETMQQLDFKFTFTSMLAQARATGASKMRVKVK
jgi:hypothetical protein